MPYRAEGLQDRSNALTVRLAGTDEYLEVAGRGLGHAASNRCVDQRYALWQPSRDRADLFRADGRHVDEDLAGRECACQPRGPEHDLPERLRCPEHRDDEAGAS